MLIKNAQGKQEKRTIDADDIGVMTGSGGEGSLDFIFFWDKIEVLNGARKSKKQIIKLVIPAINILEIEATKESDDVNIKSLPRNSEEGAG